MDFDKCLMSCFHHHSIIYSGIGKTIEIVKTLRVSMDLGKDIETWTSMDLGKDIETLNRWSTIFFFKKERGSVLSVSIFWKRLWKIVTISFLNIWYIYQWNHRSLVLFWGKFIVSSLLLINIRLLKLTISPLWVLIVYKELVHFF